MKRESRKRQWITEDLIALSEAIERILALATTLAEIADARLDALVSLRTLATENEIGRRTLEHYLSLTPKQALPVYRLPQTRGKGQRRRLYTTRRDFLTWVQRFRTVGLPDLPRILRETSVGSFGSRKRLQRRPITSSHSSWRCFYCSNPINRKGRHVFAEIRHLYKRGPSRDRKRRFHPLCFLKFKGRGGRPYNPATEYEVLTSKGRGGKDTTTADAP